MYGPLRQHIGACRLTARKGVILGFGSVLAVCLLICDSSLPAALCVAPSSKDSCDDCCCLQVEISKSYSHADWREDLKRLLRRAGCDSKRIMFLFSDSQIMDEAFVEDINNMLNAGEVPNMFPSDEKMQVWPTLAS
jgi:hypothetical protein